MEHESHADKGPSSLESDSDRADDGFAPTRFFTGHFATKVAQQKKKRRKRHVAALAMVAALATIALLGIAASLGSF